jgi:hypothetical protein
MRRGALGLALFLSGFVLGAFLTDAVHIWSRPKLARVLRIAIESDEELLASRDARQGDLVQSLVHRWNAADSWDRSGFRSLDRTFRDFEEIRFLPLILWAMEDQSKRAHPNANAAGEEYYAALLRHKVALTLDALSLHASAEAQRKRAAEKVPATKSPASFAELLKSEANPTLVEVEDIVLNRN